MARPRRDKLEPDYSVLQKQPGEHVPDIHKRSKVIEFTCAGFNHDQVANYFNISVNTLKKHYENELNNSLMMRTGKLARNLFRDGLAGDKGSREFWLKCRAGFAPAKPLDDAKSSLAEALLEKLIDKL